ncbi:suppressor of G2 allele of SKP1 [Nematocida minor]|uniref:suppressor of G2 allele of SKP1 n=1 Tax=Nematocida minor TaxID=1912983 RepID=UPI0022205DDD|nr:suppressor of G2 allele of SKP1 [Nematocida minor]KAI5191992.1 suppressor of G2 allele of SKP1 [Nematocida minor]
MEYEWYESRKTATIIAGGVEWRDLKEVKKEGDLLSIAAGERLYSIRIQHDYTVEKHRVWDGKLEVVLRKKEEKKWMSLEGERVLAFERQKEVPEEKEVLSNDPVMNMLMEVYSNAPEDAKREMNKSFYESKGTELRTHSAPHKHTKKYERK